MVKEKYIVRKYPNYEEYILVDNIVADPVVYKRGSNVDIMINHNEFRAWQHYFNIDYVPPQAKDILLLHICSWSKPYDFSYIIKPIKDIADKYCSVHRAILSNAGVVPYEYQMNPTFCSYDYNPLLDTKAVDKDRKNYLFLENIEKCLHEYLVAHKRHYRAVVLYYPPITSKWVLMVKTVCDKLAIKLYITPNIKTFSKYIDKNYLNREEIFIEPAMLAHLEDALRILSRGK